MRRLKGYEVALDAAIAVFFFANIVFAARGHVFNAISAGITGAGWALTMWYQGRTVEMRGQIEWMKRNRP